MPSIIALQSTNEYLGLLKQAVFQTLLGFNSAANRWQDQLLMQSLCAAWQWFGYYTLKQTPLLMRTELTITVGSVRLNL